ncbi:cytochrome P450 [Amycolatopsis sp. K13G38]|uniref:Cytochrome P450 n=1 Tax=Amycolatopsis acididurans TaxID=2724524 RepID=A0ABX1J3X8_9PSEU|nr:cytochrome P450 [Amycolatopsis acididurans]NKQ53030.1 cytochrome P450 [Amycolatopsis acididurans]
MNTASRADALKFAAAVALPTVAGGVIKRRRRVMGLLERTQADSSAVRMMQTFRSRYGTEPLRLPIPGRSLAVVMSRHDVGRVLDGTPEPFSPANLEKRAALAQFQPHGVLISEGAERERRRDFNERVLQTQDRLHHLTPVVLAKIREEVASLPERGSLDWDQFAVVWWRLVRRITLGDGARDDNVTTDLLARLRLAANWSYLAPPRKALRRRVMERLHGHLERAEADSLAGTIAGAAPSPDIDAVSQVGHWLFAFDAAGMVALRALALLATHPEQRHRALEEVASAPDLPYLRACVLDTVRLWPTTPVILRDATKETDSMAAGTALLIFTPFFHRDDENLPYAHSFAPDIWLDGRAQGNPALVPFSAGPGECPARNLVLTVTSCLLAELLRGREFQLTSGQRLGASRPLPATLDNFGLAFSVRGRDGLLQQ